MKPQKDKQKALALYIDNLSTEQIAKKIGVQRKTIREWEKKFGWKKIREETINRIAEKQPEKYQEIIEEQMQIVKLAHKELLIRLKDSPEAIKGQDLVNITKHGLEVVRPKTMSQFNFMKQEVMNDRTYRFILENGNGNKAVGKAA